MSTTERKKIPETTRLKLWVKAGGRCEFPGCNEEVWRDDLTQQIDNFAHVAHNVAASPDGPRGDEELSPELQTDYDNLLLLCLTHSKLVDGRNQEHYTVEQLKEYKVRHEERIQLQTSLGPDLKTTVVRLQAPIRERRVAVSKAQTYEALDNRFPSDDKGVFLDFSNKAGSGDEAFWTEYGREIAVEVKHAFRNGNNEMRYDHLSVFALAPIPVLAHFGNQIGNIVPTDLYQKHRDTDDWKWKDEDGQAFNYVYTKPSADASGKDVALVLSLSGTIHPDSYKAVLGDAPVYEITISEPNPTFLTTSSRLDKFKTLYRKVVSEIQARHGSDATIHLFPAIPAPIAVACGQQILPKADPAMRIYDYDNKHGGFVPTLTINTYDK